MNTQTPMPPTPPVPPVPPMPQLPRKEKNYTPWLIGCGVVFLLFFMALIGIAIYFVGSEGPAIFGSPPKVKMMNELNPAELQFIKEKKLLNGTEKLITYYDLWIDQSEISILTSERLVYYTNGNITAIPLNEIKEVKREKQDDGFDMAGDVFIITSQSGEKMKIEIAEFEGGDIFEKELNAAREAIKK